MGNVCAVVSCCAYSDYVGGCHSLFCGDLFVGSIWFSRSYSFDNYAGLLRDWIVQWQFLCANQRVLQVVQALELILPLYLFCCISLSLM